MSSGASQLLVRLDTSALESRLNGLTDQCEGQVRSLRNRVEDCTADVRAVVADVAAIQRFLLSYHNTQMTAALSSDDGSGTNPAPTDPVEACTTPSLQASATENQLKMVTIARRLLADNTALRTSLEKATATLDSYNATQESLQREVVRLRELTSQQSERLQSLSDWLGMSGLPMIADADGAAAEDTNATGGYTAQADGNRAPTAERLAQSTEAVLSRSPLLLSFRRFLLRDLTERLTSVVEQQSKDFHDSVAHLESRIQSGQCVVMGGGGAGGDAQQGGDSSVDLLETVRTLSKRVKEIDQRAVKREEFTSLMRSKADSLLLPVKADSAAVSEMERRLATRCADLEERCAYADAERAEFRAILRSLIAAAQSTSSTASRPSGRTSPDPGAAAHPRGAVLRDVLPSLGNGGVSNTTVVQAAVAAPKSQPSNTPRGAAATSSSSAPPTPPPPSTTASSSQQQQQQQLYRVVGNSQGLGVHGLPAGTSASAAAGSSTATTTTSTAHPRRDPARPRSTPAKEDEAPAVAIGMTSTQGDYANYVSQQLNRKQISTLPTLPYERLTNSQ